MPNPMVIETLHLNTKECKDKLDRKREEMLKLEKDMEASKMQNIFKGVSLDDKQNQSQILRYLVQALDEANLKFGEAMNFVENILKESRMIETFIEEMKEEKEAFNYARVKEVLVELV